MTLERLPRAGVYWAFDVQSSNPAATREALRLGQGDAGVGCGKRDGA
jgi:hypothetical protein